jgi:ribokinase
VRTAIDYPSEDGRVAVASPSKRGAMNMKAARVIVVGSCNRDHAWLCERFPQPGETRRALDFHSGAGGKGYNQAVACRRQQVATCLIAALGEDDIATLTRRSASQEQLDARWQTVRGARSGNACVLVDTHGQNLIAVDLAANEWLAAAHVRAQQRTFTTARAVLCQLETGLAPVHEALSMARRHGALALLNPAPVHADVDDELLAAADVLIPNESEFAILLQRLAGISVAPDALATLPDAALATLAGKLPTPSVIVTLGAAGCFIAHRDAPRLGDATAHGRVPASAVRPVDSTGAGDTFCGALAAARTWSESAPFLAAVQHASRCAALSTERRGAATAAPTLQEVRARFPIA